MPQSVGAIRGGDGQVVTLLPAVWAQNIPASRNDNTAAYAAGGGLLGVAVGSMIEKSADSDPSDQYVVYKAGVHTWKTTISRLAWIQQCVALELRNAGYVVQEASSCPVGSLCLQPQVFLCESTVKTGAFSMDVDTQVAILMAASFPDGSGSQTMIKGAGAVHNIAWLASSHFNQAFNEAMANAFASGGDAVGSVLASAGSRTKPDAVAQPSAPATNSLAFAAANPAPVSNIALGASASGLVGSAPAGGRFALLVGISEYSGGDASGLAKLQYASKDARDFEAALRGLGWQPHEIKTLTDEKATRSSIEYAINAWLRQAKEDDLVVFYWAGHAYPDPSEPERVFFASHDSNALDNPYSGLDMETVHERLKALRARHVVAIVDTCHSGRFSTRGTADARSIGKVQFENLAGREELPPGWIYFLGAQTEERAFELPELDNGVFTHDLLKALENADKTPGVGNGDGVASMKELRDFIVDRSRFPEVPDHIRGAASPKIESNNTDMAIWGLTLHP